MTTPPLPSDEALRKLCDDATRGPWMVDKYGAIVVADGTEYTDRRVCVVRADGETTVSDDNFIAAARSAVPSLLDRAIAAERRVGELEAKEAQWDEAYAKFSANEVHLRAALEEIAENCEGAITGGLPHFTRRDIADAAATRARTALSTSGSAR